MKRVLTAVTMAFALSLSVSACAAESPILPSGASATTEAAGIEVNTADLDFVVKAMVLLQSSVEIGRLVLDDPDLNPEVRIIAEKSVARPQDEIIQLNALLDEWELAAGDMRPHAENAIKATAAIGSDGARESSDGMGDAQILADSPAEQREMTYLLLLRQQLNEAIRLTRNVDTAGESSRLRGIAEQMVMVKSGRILEIDEYLQSIDLEPRELR